MEKRHPDYTVSTPVNVEGKDGEKTYWTRLGIAFANRNGGGEITSISLRLNGNPINGELVLFPWESDEASARD